MTKGEVKRLRLAGYVPISVQHKGDETVHLELHTAELERFLQEHGEFSLLELELPDGKKKTAIVKSQQREPVYHKLLHVTFQAVSRHDKITAHIPLRFHGEPEEVRNHVAVPQHVLETVEVRSQADHLPDHISADVSAVSTGQALRVRDLAAIAGVEYLTPGDTVLYTVSHLRAEVAPAVAEAVAAEAPEAAPESA
ncbi:MAG: 50S ribosomal protein L25 [Armatimonadetes bacterium]|nr:50S ribosomal protein L25 [Armatimonadota bacterium]